MESRETLVELDLCFVDERYQRKLAVGKLAQLRKEYDARVAQPLLLSERQDGRFAIIDGQHTKEAALANGMTKHPARILHGLDLAEEAAMFRKRNTIRGSVRSIEVFQARLVEGNLGRWRYRR